ncbi:MAG TPA: transposase family protein [Kofleriaceae bacterium]|nr:transposase family protein [Kofleriaceae bacterium]
MFVRTARPLSRRPHGSILRHPSDNDDPSHARARVDQPPSPRSRGRPWSCSLRHRVLIAATALRTNLTMRELAAVFEISKSAVHRILATLTPKLAALARETACRDRRWSWIVDGAQVFVRGRDLGIVASTAGGPGNRNDPVHYRDSCVQALCQQHGRVLADGGYRGLPELVTPTFCGRRMLRDAAWRRHRTRRARVEHAIARLKVWRVLRDHRRQGSNLDDTLGAVALLHNLSIRFLDSP